jgi:hypothetical protein
MKIRLHVWGPFALTLALLLSPVFSASAGAQIDSGAAGVHRLALSEAQSRALIFAPQSWMTLAPQQKAAAHLELRRILERGSDQQIAALPAFVTFSDQHGTIDRFDALLLDALRSVPAGKSLATLAALDPEQTLAAQLAANGVRLDDFRGQLFFHNAGDLVDRGPRGLALFKRSREMIAAGLMDFVIGNHDFWMMLNLQGFHLPFYDNYAFYGYRDGYDARHGRVDELLARQLRNAEIRSPDWWEAKLAEFTVRQSQAKWEQAGGVKSRVNGLFKALTAGQSSDDLKRWSLTPEGEVWNRLRGYDVKVGDVYVGVRGVGMVSLKWWQELHGAFEAGLASIADNDPRRKLWLAAIAIIGDEIIPVLAREIDDSLSRGEWWVRVFEAINYSNYESAEWWAKDWAFHNDWGTSILKEISPAFREDRLDGEVSFANYLKQPVLREMSEFLRANFNLYRQDVYGNTILHGLLPVDLLTGEFYFSYRGQAYRGRGSRATPSVWQGLARIEKDVRDTRRSLSELHEALSLVNSWYADRTTIAKAVNVAAAINRVGPEKLARVNGFSHLYLGHVPFTEFLTRLTPEQRGDRIQGFLIEDRIVLTDHGMGKRFGSRGAYVSASPGAGISLHGFEQAKARRVIADPRTVEVGANGGEAVLSTNRGLHRLLFRNYLLEMINDEARSPAAAGQK